MEISKKEQFLERAMDDIYTLIAHSEGTDKEKLVSAYKQLADLEIPKSDFHKSNLYLLH